MCVASVVCFRVVSGIVAIFVVCYVGVVAHDVVAGGVVFFVVGVAVIYIVVVDVGCCIVVVVGVVGVDVMIVFFCYCCWWWCCGVTVDGIGVCMYIATSYYNKISGICIVVYLTIVVYHIVILPFRETHTNLS